MNENIVGLKAEICFWRELLCESSFSFHSPECKRMEEALQLAQEKLMAYESQAGFLPDVTAKKLIN